jgi:sigma-B regulation protein RsbU (phosphoserine phosphatase)
MPDDLVPEHADILIVDDSAANLRLLSQTLSEHGYHVRAVNSGERALASAQAAPPHLILLDIRMPIMDGFEVCRRLKADERTREVPVIFISALDAVADKVQAFAVGGVDYVTKPFQVEEVLARTATHLAIRRLQKRLEAANRRYARELRLAALVQASFLTGELPELPGWQVATRLQPAREMSGDFFVVTRLPDGLVAVMMADVVDKGVPAALLMAISWGLLEPFASQYPDEPERVLQAMSEKLLHHLDGNYFLTAFYGVLDTDNGRFRYCNAGHPPALWLTAGGRIQELCCTGMPLGIMEASQWQTREIQLEPGECLVLYTDGVMDAEASDGDYFGRGRLQTAVLAAAGGTAETICAAVETAVAQHTGDQPQLDDIALLVLRREK